ncbi:hypothetical protein ACFUJR_32680 [Streptomyces sp. NPDC057271]|uniref:hypothetical protein n=1 Tax=unclassified Streptomyces TaxID=2593676 RepID=UPI00363EBFCD
MEHRTDLSQADEGLRQARIDTPIRDGLRYIAGRLANRRPAALMTEGARLAIALSAAEYISGGPSDTADALERELLQRMPHVDRPITRGEYALLLNKKTWSAA